MKAKKKIVKKINKKFEDFDESDLGGSEPKEALKDLKLIVNDGQNVLFQDKHFTYLLINGVLERL